MADEPGLSNSKELDHIRPLASGGTHTVGNVRIICRACNARRPVDGSDYAGELPPTAVDRAAAWAYVERQRVERERAEARRPTVTRKQTAERGKTAAAMRAQGLKWDTIAEMLGYSAAAGAYLAAKAHGSLDQIALWPSYVKKEALVSA